MCVPSETETYLEVVVVVVLMPILSAFLSQARRTKEIRKDTHTHISNLTLRKEEATVLSLGD